MTTTWHITDPDIGTQQIGTSSATQNHPLGKIVRAKHNTLGGGEFIYLEGVASTVVGSIVNYDDSFQTALHSTALDHPRPLAIAMSANGAGAFDWYQIAGISVVTKANSLSLAKGATIGAGSGIAIAAATGGILNGMLVAVVASAKSDVVTVKVMTDRPHDTSDLS